MAKRSFRFSRSLINFRIGCENDVAYGIKLVKSAKLDVVELMKYVCPLKAHELGWEIRVSHRGIIL